MPLPGCLLGPLGALLVGPGSLLLAPLHPHRLRLPAFCCPLLAHDGDSSRSVPTWLARPGSRSFTIIITVSI